MIVTLAGVSLVGAHCRPGTRLRKKARFQISFVTFEPPARTRIDKPAFRGFLRQSIETDYTYADSVSVACPNFLDEISSTIRTDVLNKRSPRNELELPRNPVVAFPRPNPC